MKVKQKLSILFYLFRQKENKDGQVPIYIRITIDGNDAETSLGRKIHPDDWNNKKKCSRKKDDEAKEINAAIDKAKADLRRHFDVLEAQHPYVTTEMLKKAYLKKPTGEENKQVKDENGSFSKTVDDLIRQYVNYLKEEKKERESRKLHDQEIRFKALAQQKKKITDLVKETRENANKLFDCAERPKSLLNAVNEHLLNFLELVIAGHRTDSTLKKWAGTKIKVLEFLVNRYNAEDLPLPSIELKFATHLKDYLIPVLQLEQNTAMKHIKNVKQIFERAVDNGWIEKNPIEKFKCPYKDPEPEVLTMHDVVNIMKLDFGKLERLDRVRDFFIFSCFTGFAFTDAMNLTHEDIFIGVDGKEWITTKRIKTKNPETVPLLPITKLLIQKYANDKRTAIDNRLFPKISLGNFNGYLKEIGTLAKIRFDLTSHKARYFFANVVTHDNGVSIKTVGKMLGQKTVRTTEKYLVANVQNISHSMKMVEKKLFTTTGKLRAMQGETKIKTEKKQETTKVPIHNGLRVIYKTTEGAVPT